MSDKAEGSKLTVPKFASFKSGDEPTRELKAPKFSSFKSKEPARNTGDSEARPAKDHDRESRRGRHSDGSHHHSRRRHHDAHERPRNRERKRSRSRSRSRSRAPDERPKSKVARGSPGGEPNVFVIDTKGDPLIRKYGLDRSRIPAYYRYGFGRVLGTEGRLVIHRDGPRDQFSLRMPGEGSAAFQDKDGLRSRTWRIRPKPIRVRRRAAEASDEENDGFLPLTSRKRKRGRGDVEDSSDDEEQPSYRSIEGKAKPHQYSDSELDYDSEPSNEALVADRDNPLKWKSMQLSQRVKDHPEDIDAWLELADHQDALLRAGEDIDHKALEAEVHSYAEIKLSMLESALLNATRAEDRERVLVSLMRGGVKVWNSKTAAKKWSEVLKDEQRNFALWRTHLDFAVSNIATFQYEDVKKMHLDRLRQAISRGNPDTLSEDFSEAIYVFLRATRLIHDAGFKELAIAAWQGVLELNCFRPGQLESQSSVLTAFQDFWESEVPRIGDRDAQGWISFFESGGVGDPPEPVEDDKGEPEAQSRDAYKSWAVLEHRSAEKAGMPARTMDEGTEDDPFRVAMYSDIEPLLFVIPSHVLPGVIRQLLDAFLIFCRLPPVFRSSGWTETAHHDQFLTGPLAGTGLTKQAEPTSAPVDETQLQRRPPSFDDGGIYAAYSPDLLFPGKDWFKYIPRDSHVELSFVVNTAKQLTHVAKLEGLAEYYLALCSSQGSTAVRKPAKALLKQYPSNIGLYNAYALAEFASGKPDVAAKVLGPAIELGLSTSSPDVFLLWRSWSWMELELSNKRLATKRLCSSTDEVLRRAPDDIDVSSTHILKAQQAFSSGITHLLSIGDLDLASVHAECLVLLAYLTADGYSEPTSASQGNVTAAMATAQKASEEFKSRGRQSSLAHERVLQFAARILYLNACRGPFRRAYLLDRLTDFLAYFPRNTVFLSLFEWADSGLRVIDQVRTLLHEKVLTPSYDCVTSRVFAIQHEMKRGNVHTTKAAFEHAVSSDASKFNVPLWVSYIRFCASQRELRAKAKDVLFRALRHCPGSKGVMMEAFVTLNREMESSELRSVFNTMTTKGLRVHVDLEEYLEKRREERKQRERR